MLSSLLGLLIMGVGIVLGIWLGVIVFFLGGIQQFVEGLKLLNSSDIAWGIVKIFSSGIVGWISFFLCFGLGLCLIRRE